MRCMTVGLWPSGIFFILRFYPLATHFLIHYCLVTRTLAPFSLYWPLSVLFVFLFRPKQASGSPFRDFVAFGLIRMFSFRRAEHP